MRKSMKGMKMWRKERMDNINQSFFSNLGRIGWIISTNH